MALTAAERQAAMKQRRQQKADALQKQVADLTAALAERDRENHVLRRIITQQGWRAEMQDELEIDRKGHPF